jgi:hypothetical protein
VKRTEGGRVTDEHLAELEADANRYPKPWTMGVGSHVMAALIRELRELRASRDQGAPSPEECDCDYWHSKHRWHCATNYPPRPVPPGVGSP